MAQEIILREYQDESVEGLRTGIRAGRRNQVLCAPTAAGKTVCAAYLLKECYEKEKRGIFLVDRLALINQTSAVLDFYGIPHGIIQSDHWRRRPHERIQIASVQTIMKRGFPKVDLLCVDECHCLHKTTLEHIEKRECITIGLSATPFSKGMGKFYDGIVNVRTTNQLIEEKFLVPFQVFSASEPDMEGAKTVAGEWTDAEASSRAMPIVGDCVAEYINRGQDKKFIAFGCNVAHCEELRRQFLASGIRVELYTYKTGDEERQMFLDEFKKPDSSIRGLISVAALSKGFDQTDVGVIIMCRPLKSSLAEHIQILGRGLRIHPEKSQCIVLDHSGNMARFWWDMHDFFENGIHELDDGKTKEKPKPKEKEEKKPRNCPKCHRVHDPAPFCPNCGYEYPARQSVQHEAGELKEIGGGGIIRCATDKRQLFAELKSIALARGWSDGRLSNVHKDLTGTWPNAYHDETPLPPSEDTLKKVRALTIRFIHSARGREWARNKKKATA